MSLAPKDLMVDGDFKTAQPEGPLRLIQPFEGDNGYYLLEEDYTQFLEYFTALDLNSQHAAYLDYFLVKESTLQPVGVSSIVKWTRTYAKVPNSRDDPSTLAYNFIGFYGTIANIAVSSTFPVIGRNRFTDPVNCRVHYDYYRVIDGATIVDVTGTNVFTGTPNVTPPSEAIPTINAQLYYIPLGTVSGGVFTRTYTAGSANDILFGTPTDYLYDAAAWGNLIPTTPTRAAYQTLKGAGGEIVAEASQVGRWMGNIWFRVTKYVLAQ